jgi:hypothetical protein
MRNWSRGLAVGALASLMVPGLFAGTGDGLTQGVATSIGEVEQEVIRLHGLYDSVVGPYDQLARQANGIEHSFRGKGDNLRNIGVKGAPSAFGQLYVSDLLEYFPKPMIDDVNRRIYREYVRGYREWEAGVYPPARYMTYDSGGWTRSIFDNWNQDVYLVWNLPSRPWGLYIDKTGGRGGAVDIEGAIQGLERLRQAAERTLPAAKSYRVRSHKEGRFIKRTIWDNRSEWSGIKSNVESAFTTYRNAVAQVKASVQSQARYVVEQVIRYDRSKGGSPVIEFLLWSALRSTSPRSTGTGYGTPGYGGMTSTRSRGTGNGYSNPNSWVLGRDLRPSSSLTGEALFAWSFDQTLLRSLPDNYSSVIEKKLAHAFFRGAYDAKYSGNLYSSSGGGYSSYSWSTRYSTSGTGNGYDYGGSRSRRSTGRRTSQSWNSTGDGYGNGTSGTGGGRSSSSSTGTGGGSTYTPPRRSSGTGGGYSSGSTYTPPRRSSSGTGGGTSGTSSRYRSPSRSSTGTGTGGGSYGSSRRSGGTGTGTGSGY